MEIKFSKAALEDIPDLNQISVESKMYWDYPQEWLKNWIEILTITPEYLRSNSLFKIESEPENIVGFCAIENKDDFFEVSHLWVLPEFIGKGLGRYLLVESLKKVVPEGAEVRVEADPNAEPFYSKQGFITYDQIESYPKGRFLPLMKMIYKA